MHKTQLMLVVVSCWIDSRWNRAAQLDRFLLELVVSCSQVGAASMTHTALAPTKPPSAISHSVLQTFSLSINDKGS